MDWLWSNKKKNRKKEEEAIEFINQINKKDQGKFVKIAMINKTLKDTIHVMSENIDSMSDRGENLNILIEKSDDLELSSKLFMIKSSPWYWKFFYGFVDILCCHSSRAQRNE